MLEKRNQIKVIIERYSLALDSMGRLMIEPKFEHDCKRCVFLGRTSAEDVAEDWKSTAPEGWDYYYCHYKGRISLIGRFSSEPSEYYSSPIECTYENIPGHPLIEAKRLFNLIEKPLNMRYYMMLDKVCQFLTIRRVKYSENNKPKQRLYMFVLHLLGAVDFLVYTLSLSMYTTDLRSKWIFSDCFLGVDDD